MGEVKKAKVGHPTTYTEELASNICARLACGESMRSVSRDPAMPAMSTLFKWLGNNEQFNKQYTKAKEESADAIYEDIMEIADNGTNDWVEQHGDSDTKAAYKLNGESIQRSRLRVDARKWMASKMKPKKYGDRQIIDQTTTVVELDDVKKAEQFLIDNGIDPSKL